MKTAYPHRLSLNAIGCSLDKKYSTKTTEIWRFKNNAACDKFYEIRNKIGFNTILHNATTNGTFVVCLDMPE